MLQAVLLGTLAAAVTYALWICVARSVYTSPLLRLRGPPAPSFFTGHLKQTARVTEPLLFQEWVKMYGHTVLTRWFIMIPCLWTVDPRAIQHITTAPAVYTKPLEGRQQAARIIGKSSLLIAQGALHKKLRKIMNPAFGSAQIRELTPIFFEKAAELRDMWITRMASRGGHMPVNMSEELGKLTLDVIGLAGFDYDLGSLNPPEGGSAELSSAFRDLFKKPPDMSILRIVKESIPLFDFFMDERMKKLEEAKGIMQRHIRNIIKQKKIAIQGLMAKDAAVEKSDVQGRDLLSLLIKANMASDIPDEQRLSDEELLAQIPTFLAAGHETTSTAASWCLYALSQTPRVQSKLREELLAIPTDTPSTETLSGLRYLDCVVRETLRLHAPVRLTMRVATEDDTIPLSEPIVDKAGNIQHEIHIAKGDRIIIPIHVVNCLGSIWGDSALEFRPERWENRPEATSSIPGIWGNLLTFLGGPHACIGYRFSITELKAIVFTLVRAFEFELGVPAEDVVPFGTLVARPTVRGESEKGAQMPMIVRAYERG